MTTHELKVDSAYFAALADGSKTFEVRRNDRSYQVGDVLLLGCWSTASRCWTQHNGSYDRLRRRVTYVYSGDPRFGGHGGLAQGYVVLGLGPAEGAAHV